MAELFHSKKDNTPIEANRVSKETATAVALWCGGVEVVESDPFDHAVTFAAINVPTVNGMMRAQQDDWIIRRPTGDFYPVKQGRFEELFEPTV